MGSKKVFHYFLSNYRFGGGKGKTRLNKELDPLLEDAIKAIRTKYICEIRYRSRSRSLEKINEKKEETKRDDNRKDKDDNKRHRDEVRKDKEDQKAP